MRKPKRTIRSKARPKSKVRTKTSRARKGSESSGATGFAKASGIRKRQEEDYQRQKDTPYDFRIKPGEEAEIVILDGPDREDPFFVTLHTVKNAKGRWDDAVCIADSGQNCPLCASLGKEGSFIMVLTILDRRPYKIQGGPNAGKVIKNSKKLLKVKGRNMAKFERQWKRHKGNWRGLRVNCRRDGDNEAAIGEDLEFLGRVKESALKKYKENQIPADYEKIFEAPTAKEMAARYRLGSGGVAGSEEFEDNDTGGDGLDGVKW